MASFIICYDEVHQSPNYILKDTTFKSGSLKLNTWQLYNGGILHLAVDIVDSPVQIWVSGLVDVSIYSV